MKRKKFITKILIIGSSKGIVVPVELIRQHNLEVGDILEVRFKIMGRENANKGEK